MADWIIFWENYLHQYPESHFKHEAKDSISYYQRYLFLGLENTPIFEINDLNVKITPDGLNAIQKLSKTQSESAEKAKKFLNYFHDYKFTDSTFNEETGSQSEYYLFLNETRQGIERFNKNYANDLIKLLNLPKS